MTPQLQSLIQMKQWCSSLARAHTEVKQCASKKNVSEVGQSVCGGAGGKKSLLVRLMEGEKTTKRDNFVYKIKSVARQKQSHLTEPCLPCKFD